MSSKTSEIFEFNKMICIYLITIVIASLYLIHTAIRREQIVMSVIYIPLLFFIVSQLLSTVFSIDVHTSIFGYYGRWNGGLLSIISYITLFYIAVQTFNFFHVRRLLKASLIASGLVILWGLPGKFGFDLSCYVFTGQLTNICWTNDFNPAERMFSTLGQPNWLGAYLAIHFFIGLYFLLDRVYKPRPELVSEPVLNSFQESFMRLIRIPKLVWHDGLSIVYLIYLIVTFLVILFTKSRSALLAVTVGIIVGSLFIFKELLPFKEKTQKIIVFSLGILILIGIMITIQRRIVSDFFSLPSEATAITDSFDIRKVVWKGAIDLGKQHPLFGSGVETFAYAYYFTRPSAHNLTSEWDFIYNKAHNEYLNYFATTGYFGLITYLLLIATFYILSFNDIFKIRDHKKRLLIGCIMLAYTTILITNFFGFSVSAIQIFFYLFPALVLAISREKSVSQTYSLHELRKLSNSTKVMTAVILIFGVIGVNFLFNYYSADVLYAEARQLMDNNEYTEAYGKLSTALRKKYEHIYEDKLSNTAANLAFLDSFTKEKKLVLQLINLSKEANNHSLQVSKNNILYLRTKGKNHYLYYQTTHSISDIQNAVAAMEEAVRIAKTDVQSKYTLALFYYIASQEITDKDIAEHYSEKTLSTLSEVIHMKPNYIEAQELYTEIINNE